jgi:hypothetical protein
LDPIIGRSGLLSNQTRQLQISCGRGFSLDERPQISGGGGGFFDERPNPATVASFSTNRVRHAPLDSSCEQRGQKEGHALKFQPHQAFCAMGETENELEKTGDLMGLGSAFGGALFFFPICGIYTGQLFWPKS